MKILIHRTRVPLPLVSVVTLLVLGLAWPIAGGAAPAEQKAAQKKDDKKKSKLPPLIVDTESPLLLDDPGAKTKDQDLAPNVLENNACYVCHANYRREELTNLHADGDVGCIDCHGKSYAHRNDENNTTPPDVMFPLSEIDDGCATCHDTHDVPAHQVIARLQERQLRPSEVEKIVCTDCHGRHRLKHRTVVWNRKTRKLLTGSEEEAAKNIRPTLERLKRLAGTWVKADPTGQPTDEVISVYQVTAAGTAVMETLFPNSDHEMITLYHQDGDDLFLTHYCAAGNQPRMKCRVGTDARQLVFEFVDGTNMDPSSDRHMHAVAITFLGPHRLQADWKAYDNGKQVGTVQFDLVRKPQ